MKPLEPHDIVRYLNGEVEDPAEFRRITKEIEQNPQVRGWCEMLDLESLLPDEEPEKDNSPEFKAFEAMVSGEISSRRSAELWRLRGDQPLCRLLTGTDAITGRVVRRAKGKMVDIPFRIERSGGDESVFLLKADLPDGFQPRGLRLGKFVYRQFEPASADFQLKSVKRAPGRKAPAKLTPLSLAADSGDESKKGQDCIGKSADVKWTYRRSRLEITATHPDELADDLVVAELAHSDGHVERKIVQLGFQRSDKRWKGNTSFEVRPPASQIGDTNVLPLPGPTATKPAADTGETPTFVAPESITVRPLTDDDLPLLEPNDLTAFLTKQEFVALPIEETIDAFSFRVRWDDQRQAISDPDTCWCLEVAATGREG